MNECKFFFFFLVFTGICLCKTQTEFPFYEDYLKDSDFRGFIEEANEYIADKPDSPEAPRLAYDLMMVGKAASDAQTVRKATSLLLFNYTKSLPTLNFISSFEKGSTRLTELLKSKIEEADLGSKDFAVSFCRVILFVARVHGPELLKDKSLRLMCHLLAEKAEVREITSSTTKTIKESENEDSNYGKTVKVALSEKSNLDKILELDLINGKDAELCKSFFLAQLDGKEANSEVMLVFKINQFVFNMNPQPKKALELIKSLTAEKKNSPDIKFITAICYQFSDQTEKAIETLIGISSEKKNSQKWKKGAESYAEGLKFIQNRKSVFSDAIGKVIDNLDRESDSLFLKVKFEINEKDSYEIYVGSSRTEERFEVQVHKNKKLKAAYLTEGNQSSVLSLDTAEIISFNSSGALPVPRFDIVREPETGFFSYNFNLNFGSSFSNFIEQGSEIIENPYLKTSKGRDVLLNHIFQNKPIWLGAATNADEGTTFSVIAFSDQKQSFNTSYLTVDLAGNLKSLSLGDITLTDIQFGEAEILSSMPQWPNLPEEKKEKFDFTIFMKILGNVSKIFQ